jgi:hypothetical protein
MWSRSAEMRGRNERATSSSGALISSAGMDFLRQGSITDRSMSINDMEHIGNCPAIL